MKPSCRPKQAKYVLAYILYRVTTVLLVPALVIQLLLRSVTRLKAYRHRMGERFGIIRAPQHTNGLLIHCVSVGEVTVAAKLIERLLQRNPDEFITVTTTTPTGSERLQQLLGKRVNHCYLPYDMGFAMGRLINVIQPRHVLITEVELWPTLITRCWQHNIPVSVINARMTERSAQRYRKVDWLFTPMLQKIHMIGAQSERDFIQYQQLGATPSQLRLTHNIKFDVTITANDKQKIQSLSHRFSWSERPVLIAASTHETEEEYILSAFDELRKKHPRLLLILVPRHPQRFTNVENTLTNYRYVRLSDNHHVTDTTDIIYGNTLGELNALYAYADMAFIGGSLASKGGHNPLEACVHQIPCMIGPHTYNNPHICEALEQAGALIRVASSADIVNCVDGWITSPSHRQQQGQAGINTIQQNSGAIEANLAHLGL